MAGMLTTAYPQLEQNTLIGIVFKYSNVHLVPRWQTMQRSYPLPLTQRVQKTAVNRKRVQ
jgi:hypothetical protein